MFNHIAISSSLLVATTNKERCHVMVHADDNGVSFPLASNSVEKITTSGDTVAVLLYDRSREDGMQVDVTIWTLKSKKSIQCRAKLQGPPIGRDSRHDIKIMIGTSLEYLVLFERCDSLRSFYFTRFSLDGQLHSQGSLEGPDTATFDRHSESLIPSDVGGYSTIWSYSRKQEVGGTDRECTELILVQYYPQQNQMRLNAECIPWMYPLNRAKFSIWKHVIYYRTSVLSALRLCNLSTNQDNDATTMGRSYQVSNIRGNFEILSDENFIVNVSDQGFRAWCFNKDTRMNRADETYAQHRQDEIQKRRQRYQEWDARNLRKILRSEEIDLDITGTVRTYRALQERENQ